MELKGNRRNIAFGGNWKGTGATLLLEGIGKESSQRCFWKKFERNRHNIAFGGNRKGIENSIFYLYSIRLP